MAKVMLVEDDNNLREIYEARLQAEGYTIVSAKDGEEALVVAKAEKPDLIISDVMMPKISGFEMLDILRNTDGLKNVKVIMLTALGQSDDQQRADRLGADRYLVKSQVTLEDIVKVAHELLGDNGAPAAAADPADATPTPAPDPAAEPQDTGTAPAPDAPVSPAPAEPVVAAPPVTEPPVDPATPSAPAPEPPTPADATPTPVPTQQQASPAATDAQSTAQEEANVEAKIEDFVAGATSTPSDSTSASSVAAPPANDTSTPPPADPATPSAPAPEPPTPADATPTPVPDPAAEAKDEKLLENAVEALETEAAKKAENVAAPTAIPVIEPVSESVESTESTPAAEPQNQETPSAEPQEPTNGSVKIANKKVITPIDSGPKQDINELLALEEAKEASTQGPPPPAAIIADNETGTEVTPLAPLPEGQAPEATDFAASKIEKAKISSQPGEPGEEPENPADPGSVAL